MPRSSARPPAASTRRFRRRGLPGSRIDKVGLYVSYDVAYPISSALSVRGAVSYGPRDGEAHFGGSLGGAVTF
jgi:hypothetical protein